MDIRKLGVALVALGILLPFIGIQPPTFMAATVIYDSQPPALYSPYPASTSQSTPTPLPAGQTITLSVNVDDDTEVKSVEVAIYRGGTQLLQTLQLAWSSANPGGLGSRFTAKWTVPQDTGVLYKFTFTALDLADNKAALSTWGKTGTPDGYFTINGIRADEQTTIAVRDPTLQIAFIATSMGDQVTNIQVVVKDRSGLTIHSFYLTETSPDTQWSGTYTLPRKGVYTVEGNLITTGLSLRKMSITVPYGQDQFATPTVGQLFNAVTLTGFILTVFGTFMKRRGEA